MARRIAAPFASPVALGQWALLCATGCNALVGNDERRCVPGCVDEETRLVCLDGTTAVAETCPRSNEVCAAPACRAGSCGFRPAVGAPCGPDGNASCNEGYACLGPEARLSAVFDNTCALAGDGKVWCWGDNTARQLGDGTQEDRGNPVPVRHLPRPALSVAVGYRHACALVDGGEVYCWGHNSGAQCGTGLPTDSLAEPRLVPAAGVRFTSVKSGALHTCAIAEDQSVYCWGHTIGGQCGVDAASAGSMTVGPTRIPNYDASAGAREYLGEVLDIDTVKAHTCARRASAPTMVCWGSNTYFEEGIQTHALGPGAASMAYSARPIPVDLDAPVIDVGMGFESTYAVTLDGKVFAWGYNGRGQLGVENMEIVVREPARVFGDVRLGPAPLSNIAEVLRTDGSHQCVLPATPFIPETSRTYGAPYLCWGANDQGELGLGDSALGHQIHPFAIPARTLPDTARNLALGQDHGCVVVPRDRGADILCYGRAARVGNGTTELTVPNQWNAEPVRWIPDNFAAMLEE